MNEFDNYQEWTKTTAIYRNDEYALYGLVEEVGELFGKIAKFERKYGLYYVFEWEGRNAAEQQLQEDIIKEAGDVMWMLARVLGDRGIKLSDVIFDNVAKLESRQQRNVLEGSGDDR